MHTAPACPRTIQDERLDVTVTEPRIMRVKNFRATIKHELIIRTYDLIVITLTDLNIPVKRTKWSEKRSRRVKTVKIKQCANFYYAAQGRNHDAERCQRWVISAGRADSFPETSRSKESDRSGHSTEWKQISREERRGVAARTAAITECNDGSRVGGTWRPTALTPLEAFRGKGASGTARPR